MVGESQQREDRDGAKRAEAELVDDVAAVAGISAPAGWKGRNDTRMAVNSSAAIAVAARSRVNAALSGARSVPLRLPVLLIGISEFGKHAADSDVDWV